MTVLAVIPARWASSRFPGKALAPIAGEPMILHVARQVRLAQRVDDIVVATDDDRIADYCRTQNIAIEMTDVGHPTGTDRLAQVATRRDADIYVNVQGDEPLIAPAAIDATVGCLLDARADGTGVSTAYIAECPPENLNNRSVVHLVPTLNGRVLTFSRLPVPCDFRQAFPHTVHVGLYAFTGAALAQFAAWSIGPVEAAESIELMRFLEHGWSIACVPIAPGSLGVDHPEDVARVEAVLAGGGPGN